MLFTVFTMADVQYVAVPYGANVHILGMDGSNYGSLYSEASFREHYATEPPMALGKATLVVRTL